MHTSIKMTVNTHKKIGEWQRIGVAQCQRQRVPGCILDITKLRAQTAHKLIRDQPQSVQRHRLHSVTTRVLGNKDGHECPTMVTQGHDSGTLDSKSSCILVTDIRLRIQCIEQ